MSGNVDLFRYAAKLIYNLAENKYLDAVPNEVKLKVAQSIGIDCDEVTINNIQNLKCAYQSQLKECAHLKIYSLPEYDVMDKVTLSSKTARREFIASLTNDKPVLAIIGRSVNKDETWNVCNLIKAMKHVSDFDIAAEKYLIACKTKDESAEDIKRFLLSSCIVNFRNQNDKDSRLANKTNLNPYNFDIIMLYTICTALSIQTNRNDNIELLAYKISHYYVTNFLTPKIVKLSHTLDDFGKCSGCATLPKSKERETSIVELDINGNTFLEMSILRKSSQEDLNREIFYHLIPANEALVCVFAHILFNIDLIDSECPYIEYYALLNSINLAINKDKIERNTKLRWRPYYEKFYSVGEINSFLHKYGFIIFPSDTGIRVCSDENLASSLKSSKRVFYSSYIEALEYTSFQGSIFTFGKHHNCGNKVSPYFLEDYEEIIDQLGEYGIVSFGNENESTFFSIKDISKSLSSTSVFTITDNLGKTIHLTNRHIKNLINLCTDALEKSIPHFTRECYNSILRNIKFNEIKTREINEHGESLKNVIQNDEKLKEAVINCYKLLLDAGMFMRGWKVSEGTNKPPYRYPIDNLDTNYPPVLQDEVDMNVTLAISKYHEAVEKIDNQRARHLIKSAPLMKRILYPYDNSTRMSFIPPNNIVQGITIEDRLTIINQGQRENNIFSCLRTSSNLIVSSAYYYLVVLGYNNLDFDLASLSEIY